MLKPLDEAIIRTSQLALAEIKTSLEEHEETNELAIMLIESVIISLESVGERKTRDKQTAIDNLISAYDEYTEMSDG